MEPGDGTEVLVGGIADRHNEVLGLQNVMHRAGP